MNLLYYILTVVLVLAGIGLSFYLVMFGVWIADYIDGDWEEWPITWNGLR